MLMHVNADGRAGGVVSILPETIVPVPGHGQTQINNALVYGGPSLLVQTVEQLTHVPINHYAQLNLTRVSNVIKRGEVRQPIPPDEQPLRVFLMAPTYTVAGTDLPQLIPGWSALDGDQAELDRGFRKEVPVHAHPGRRPTDAGSAFQQ